MLLPKPKKRIRRNARSQRQKQANFSKAVRGLDGRCMNPTCPCHEETVPFGLSAHHIKYRSQGGWYVVENGITFCSISHEWSEGKGNLKDEDGNRITGLQFMISVLDYWEGKPEYRWHQVHEELRNKANV